MRFDSVRELKQSIPQFLARQFARAAVRVRARRVATGKPGAPVSVPAARAASFASVLAGYALGITARAKNDYRLAVRLQHRSLVGSDLVSAIKDKARGEVEVRYIGRVTAGLRRRQGSPWYRERQRPLVIGVSCGYLRPDLVMAGTLGCFVRRRAGGSPMILSNNHVLADEGRYRRGGRIVQPGALDGGDPSRDGVATLTSFVRLRPLPRSNYVDAAVATVNAGIQFDQAQLRSLGRLAGVAAQPLDIGDEVHKVGRTTGVRDGRVTAIEVDGVHVEYDTGIFSFDNQIEIEGTGTRAFSASGDSGSLIVNDGMEAVALLFAGSDEGGSSGRGLTYGNPIEAVLSRMRLRLLV